MQSVAQSRQRYRQLLLISLLCAIAADTLCCASLSVLNLDLQGDLHLTRDQLDLLGSCYTASKLLGWLIAPSVLRIYQRNRVFIVLVASYALASTALICTGEHGIFYYRILQGLCAGALLTLVQAQIWQQYPRRQQPMLQMIFALFAVATTINMQAYLQGLFVDANHWRYLFFIPVIFLLVALLLYPSRLTHASRTHHKLIDYLPRYLILTVFLSSLTWILERGERWNWLSSERVQLAVGLIVASILLFVFLEYLARQKMFYWQVFKISSFSFGIIVSFVAGFALFGSTYLISQYLASVCELTPTLSGETLLPGCLSFAACLLLVAYAIQYHQMSPILAVPLGISLIVLAVYLHSLSNGDSSQMQLLLPILVRGAGMGFLLMALTMITFGQVDNQKMGDAIALFSSCRQLGGLIGIAVIETYTNQFITQAQTELAGAVTVGSSQSQQLTQILSNSPLELNHVVTTIGYNNAFMIIAVMFLIAVPIIVMVRIFLTISTKAAH